MDAPAPAPTLYMDAVITPNRSLSRQGLKVLMTVLIVYNALIAVFLIVIGAFPVPIFLGIDILGVALAFHISNRRAKRAERVQVSAEQVVVLRDRDGASEPVWASPTAFTRVTVEGEEEEPEVRLNLSARSMAVAGALSPAERVEFADALKAAMRRARLERHA